MTARGKSVRIVVALDISADTPAEAYGKLLEHGLQCAAAWESTDEWYDGDASGAMTIEEIDTARKIAFDLRSGT